MAKHVQAILKTTGNSDSVYSLYFGKVVDNDSDYAIAQAEDFTCLVKPDLIDFGLTVHRFIDLSPATAIALHYTHADWDKPESADELRAMAKLNAYKNVAPLLVECADRIQRNEWILASGCLGNAIALLMTEDLELDKAVLEANVLVEGDIEFVYALRGNV